MDFRRRPMISGESGLWDAVVVSAAAHAPCQLLLSEDPQDGSTWRLYGAAGGRRPAHGRSVVRPLELNRYSALRATTGSTRPARRDGTSAATRAAARTTATVDASAVTPVVSTANSCASANPDAQRVPTSPIATPEDAAYINEHTDCVGFVGASSLERLAVEDSLTQLTRKFKKIPVRASALGGSAKKTTAKKKKQFSAQVFR